MKIIRTRCAGVEHITIFPFGERQRPAEKGGGIQDLPTVHIEKHFEGKVVVTWKSSDIWDYKEQTVKNALKFAKAFSVIEREAKRPVRLNGLMMRHVTYTSINVQKKYIVVKTDYTSKFLKKYVGRVGVCKVAYSLHGATMEFEDGKVKVVPFESLTTV